MNETDIAVVGAGPAGAWTACLLARRGARVTIFDPSHPREKPCGGGVTGRALSIVADTLPVTLTRAVPIRAARFVASARDRSTVVRLRERRSSGPAGVDPATGPSITHSLVVTARRDFDDCLLTAARNAGASLVASRAVDVSCNGRLCELRTADGRTHRARWIVGADGPNSLIRRRVARPFQRGELSIATGFFARGVTSDEIAIEFIADPPGYIWSFPRQDHLAIGICAQADAGITARSLRDVVKRWIERTSIGAGAELEPYSWPIPSLSASDYDLLELAGPGWLLVGDAAGLVDSVTREGIYFALRSAELAASTLASGTLNAAREYTRRIHADILGELRRAARLRAGFFRSGFTDLLMDALTTSETIRRIMADLIAGEQTYNGLEWRLAKTLELGIAWEFLKLSHRGRGIAGS